MVLKYILFKHTHDATILQFLLYFVPVSSSKLVQEREANKPRASVAFVLCSGGETVWETVSSGFEKVSQIFLKEISTTCTASVRRETPDAGAL